MKYTILFFSILFLNITLDLQAQDKKFQAVFIYNFYKNIEWPASYKNQDFVIGVYGNSAVIPLLEKTVENRSAGGTYKFIIKKINSIDEIGKCHMLYLPTEKSDLFPDIVKKLGGSSTLLITEKAGLGGQGSAINFVLVNDRLKFELNEYAFKKASLKVSSMFMKLAIVI